MAGKVEFGADVLGLKNMNFEKINEKRIKPFEDKSKKIQDTIDITTNTNEARGALKTLTSELEQCLSNISLHTNAKTAYISGTSEQGAGVLGEDYLEVTASNSAHVGSLEVRVEQLATYASASLQKVGGVGFAVAELFQSDALMVTITTNPVGQAPNVQDIIVEDLQGKTITEVVQKINETLKQQGVQAQALLDPAAGGLYNIKIASSLTGSKTIRLQPKEFLFVGMMQDDNTYYNTVVNPNAAGKNAIVHVNGQEVQSATNIVKLGKDAAGADIPYHIAQGVTLTLKQANTAAHHHQTIHIEQDKNAMGDKIGEFVDAYNNLREFIATQEKRNASGNGYEEDAYLAKTPELRTARDLLYSMTDQVNVAGLTKVNSLASIGVLRGQDGAGLTINNDRLKDIADSDFDEIVAFFTNAAGFGVRFTDKTKALLQLINTEAQKVPEKLIKARVEYEKAEMAMQKERKKIEEEMAQMDVINMQASMMQMYFQAMMSQ
jgi:flagellar capping protein FliD